jgi:hypothetical protein
LLKKWQTRFSGSLNEFFSKNVDHRAVEKRAMGCEGCHRHRRG